VPREGYAERVSANPSIDELRVEARYRRDRLALYRARALTGKPTSETRMRTLEREASSSELRLRAALGGQAPGVTR
jgi:hypothetical protein